MGCYYQTKLARKFSNNITTNLPLRGSLYSSAAESAAVEEAEAGAPAVRASECRQAAPKTLDYSKWDGIQSCDSGDEGEVRFREEVSSTNGQGRAKSVGTNGTIVDSSKYYYLSMYQRHLDPTVTIATL